MSADCFVDSNILVYAHDSGAGRRHTVARDLVALIVHAAQSAGAGTLYTEDLNHGQKYGSVKAVNPFE